MRRPYKDREIITYDKYDGRALVDDIPEEVPIKYDYTLEYRGEDRDLEIMLNFERYKTLVEAYRTAGDRIINTYLPFLL